MDITKRTLLKTLAAAPALAAPALLLASTSRAVAQPAMAGGSNPGYYRYRAGDIEVTALLDGTMALPANSRPAL